MSLLTPHWSSWPGLDWEDSHNPIYLCCVITNNRTLQTSARAILPTRVISGEWRHSTSTKEGSIRSSRNLLIEYQFQQGSKDQKHNKVKVLVYSICNNRFLRFHHSEKWSWWPRRTEAVRDGRGEVLEVLMMTMGKLVIGLNDWPTRTASNLQQSHLDLTSCKLFSGCSLDCVSFSYLLNWAF